MWPYFFLTLKQYFIFIFEQAGQWKPCYVPISPPVTQVNSFPPLRRLWLHKCLICPCMNVKILHEYKITCIPLFFTYMIAYYALLFCTLLFPRGNHSSVHTELPHSFSIAAFYSSIKFCHHFLSNFLLTDIDSQSFVLIINVAMNILVYILSLRL